MARYPQPRSNSSSRTSRAESEATQNQVAQNQPSTPRSTFLNHSTQGVNLSVVMVIMALIVGGVVTISANARPDQWAFIFPSPEPTTPVSPSVPSPSPLPSKSSDENLPKVLIAPSPKAISPAQMYQKTRPSVVMISTENTQG